MKCRILLGCLVLTGALLVVTATLARAKVLEAEFAEGTNMKEQLCGSASLNVEKNIRELIKKGVDVNCGCESSLGPNTFTPLQLAAMKGSLESMKILIEAGADVNKDVGEGAPLHSAAVNNQIDAVKLLISKRANVNAKTAGGNTPLHSAVFGHATTIVKFLIENNADIKVKNKNGKTPLDIARQEKFQDVVIILQNINKK